MILFLITINLPAVYSQHQTRVFSPLISTLQVHKANNWEQAPIIKLNSNEQISLSFDLLSSTPKYYTYKILHCNADWSESSLFESDYMFGIQNSPMSDYANSFNTRPDYVNYLLNLPNEETRLKVSGNYVVQVFDRDEEDMVLEACFSVVDPQIGIEMRVSSITDKGANSHYQAVAFDLSYGKEVRTPAQDLKVVVQQNNRRDNQAASISPMSIQSNRSIYDHNQKLIFPAGNEYRTFEMTTTRFNGINIESIEFYDPFYHVLLNPDPIRSTDAYSYYSDINGKIYIRNLEYEDMDLQSNYHIVHFYLPVEKPYQEDVYILSDAFNNCLDSRSRMTYSPEEGGYVKSILMKEGYYNYMYVTQKDKNSPASTLPIEGDYYQTENEYRVMIYHRPFGSRYDQLVGVSTIQIN